MSDVGKMSDQRPETESIMPGTTETELAGSSWGEVPLMQRAEEMQSIAAEQAAAFRGSETPDTEEMESSDNRERRINGILHKARHFVGNIIANAKERLQDIRVNPPSLRSERAKPVAGVALAGAGLVIGARKLFSSNKPEKGISLPIRTGDNSINTHR